MGHVHLYLDASGVLSTKTPSTTPKRPPFTRIRPDKVGAPTRPKRSQQVKPLKPAGVIKPQVGT